MKRYLARRLLTVILPLVLTVGIPTVRANENQIGIGAQYWRTVNDLHKSFDRGGVSWMLTYQRTLSRLFALQTDLEWFPSGFGGVDKTIYAPQGFILFGGSLYAGMGIGILYADGHFNDKPYYALRAGFDMEILPTVHLDINFNYQFSEWEKIKTLEEDLSSDTIFMGAAVRIEF